MKKNNNKNLVVEEYDNQFLYQSKKSNLNISFNRIAFIFFVFGIVSIIFSVKAVYLGSLTKSIKNLNFTESEFRSTIVDRNYNIIAKTVITSNIGVNPNLVIDKKRLLLNLKLIFPEKSVDEFKKIKKKLDGKKFFYVKKKVSQEQFDELMLLGDKAIISEQKISRIYPHENLFSHIVGQIDDDNNGISGLEKSFEQKLLGTNDIERYEVNAYGRRISQLEFQKGEKGKTLRLTIDTKVQQLANELLI